MRKKKKDEKKYPYECKRCFGYGLYWTPENCSVEPYPISEISIRKTTFATIPCPICGANYRPNGLKLIPSWLDKKKGGSL